MKQRPFAIITSVFQTTVLMLGAAHACANVYEHSVGNPDVTFDHNHPDFKLNVAGPIAADSAANMVAAIRKEDPYADSVTDEEYVAVLRDLAVWNLNPLEAYIAKNAANATWRTMQYARPEERWGRSVNMQFNLLTKEEKDKDVDQIKAGAKYLLSVIEKEETK